MHGLNKNCDVPEHNIIVQNNICPILEYDMLRGHCDIEIVMFIAREAKHEEHLNALNILLLHHRRRWDDMIQVFTAT